MKTKKLKLKDIVGYLAYDLHCLNCDDMIEIIEFDNIGNLVRGIDLQDDAEDDEWVTSQQYKPILRPLSDLYKTIIHNGKEIVPIMELAKIIENGDWKLEYENAVFVCPTNKNIKYYLCFEDGGFEWGLWEYGEFTEKFIINYQYLLFDYLHELKIDFRQLIENGLAVSVYDLQKNPYE